MPGRSFRWREHLNSYVPVGLGPIGVAVIFGIDELMDMGRTAVNLTGNCLGNGPRRQMEHEFDDQSANVFGLRRKSSSSSSPVT